MEEKILDELLKDTYTLEDFRKRYFALKKVVEGDLYHKTDELAEESKGELLEGFDKSLIKDLKSGDYSRINEYIEDFMRGTQALSIYFVFVPEDKQIKEIGGWLRNNLKNPRLVFQVKVDPALIGGCAIAYKGVYKDYSLRAKIKDNKTRLIEEFRKYFRQ